MAETVAKTKFSEHKIIMENRAKMTLTGVERVEVAMPSQFVCVVRGERLVVDGKNLAVDKLDVECGCVAISGEICAIRYLGEKKNLLRRIFR